MPGDKRICAARPKPDAHSSRSCINHDQPHRWQLSRSHNPAKYQSPQILSLEVPEFAKGKSFLSIAIRKNTVPFTENFSLSANSNFSGGNGFAFAPLPVFR